eukprot:m.1466224 g.1466224  ORF g.1466224 m.1466224 type:complete len:102 (-) comp25137_c0_seq1:42-347(-)
MPDATVFSRPRSTLALFVLRALGRSLALGVMLFAVLLFSVLVESHTLEFRVPFAGDFLCSLWSQRRHKKGGSSSEKFDHVGSGSGTRILRRRAGTMKMTRD